MKSVYQLATLSCQGCRCRDWRVARICDRVYQSETNIRTIKSPRMIGAPYVCIYLVLTIEEFKVVLFT
jgi:hypothetical protein